MSSAKLSPASSPTAAGGDGFVGRAGIFLKRLFSWLGLVAILALAGTPPLLVVLHRWVARLEADLVRDA